MSSIQDIAVTQHLTLSSHHKTAHQIKSHQITLHDTRLDQTRLDCTALHYTSLHYTTPHYTTLHYTTLHYTTLHYTAIHYTTPQYTTVSLFLTIQFNTIFNHFIQMTRQVLKKRLNTSHFTTKQFIRFEDTPPSYLWLGTVVRREFRIQRQCLCAPRDRARGWQSLKGNKCLQQIIIINQLIEIYHVILIITFINYFLFL